MISCVTVNLYIGFPLQKITVHNIVLYIEFRIFLNVLQQTLVHRQNLFQENKTEKEISNYDLLILFQ